MENIKFFQIECFNCPNISKENFSKCLQKAVVGGKKGNEAESQENIL